MRRSSIVLPLRVTAMSIYLVFTVNQQLRAYEGIDHTTNAHYWSGDKTSVALPRSAGYINARTSLNLRTWVGILL